MMKQGIRIYEELQREDKKVQIDDFLITRTVGTVNSSLQKRTIPSETIERRCEFMNR